MADYLPLQIVDIRENVIEEGENKGEIRKTAICRTVQPEQINLNLSRLDAQRLQKFVENKGQILMVPVRRGEFNGRAFTSVAEGHIFKDSEVVATFSLTDKQESSVAPKVEPPSPDPVAPKGANFATAASKAAA